MPQEYEALKDQPVLLPECPKCKASPFEPFLRGLIARFRKRKWIFFGEYIGYCALICSHCKEIVGWE